MKKRVIPVLVSTLMVVMSLSAAVSRAETKFDFSAYARSGFQLSGGFQKGSSLVPEKGFAISDRLQEGQYFELGATAHTANDSRFVLTVADGGDSFHYTNNWSGSSPFVVRNLYFAIDKLPDASGFSAWFGSRMYRGDSIYLFDTWPVDNQNLLGGGIAFGESTRVEFALGARNETAWTATGSNVFATSTGHRYFLINKIETPLFGGKKLKSNLELQYLPKAQGRLNDTTDFATPTDHGFFAALQYELFGTNKTFVHFGSGNLSLDKFATKPVALDGAPAFQSRTGSYFAGAGVSNALERAKWGLLYASIFQYQKIRTLNKGASLSTSIRPMAYLTDHLHAGVEVDGVHYFKRLSDDFDVGYFELSPMVEYALNRNVYGSPKLRLIGSGIFYARHQLRGGELVKRAWNLGLGFEVWL